METIYPVNPRIRAYGKARIDIARRVKDPTDWEKLWVRPSHPFPFVWGEAWKHCVEYKVDDYPAEVGFFIDVLGLEVNAFDPAYAMFTSPQGDFYLAVVPAPNEGHSTPADALRLQFMVSDILATTQQLEKRGIIFDQPPLPIQPGSSLFISTFHTPHGIPIDLWGTVEQDISSPRMDSQTQARPDDEDKDDDDDDDQLEQDKQNEDDEGELIDEEDTDMDETGLPIHDEDEDKPVFGEGDDADDEDEDLGYDDDDLDDDEDDLDLDDDDEYDDDENPEDQAVAKPSALLAHQPTLSGLNPFGSLDTHGARQLHKPEYINLDPD